MKVNFGRILAQTAMTLGEREALVNVERNRRYTVTQLHRLGNRIVNMMRERLQLRRGSVFMCILENDNLSLVHAWTVLKGEAAAAITNYRDSFDEHQWQIDFMRPSVIFIENALLDRYFEPLRQRGITVICMDPPAEPREGLLCFWDLLEGASDAEPDVESDVHHDVMMYRFTGGTTGKSKCVQYTMENWLGCRDSQFVDSDLDQLFVRDSRVLHMAPVSHGSGMSLLPTLFRGACSVTQNLPDLREWCRNVEKERITVGVLVPTLLYRLLDLKEAGEHDLSTLCTLVYGASPMSAAKLVQLQARFGNIFMQVYGASECLQIVTVLTKADHASAGEARLASAGRVTASAELIVVDEDGRPLPAGATGEIWIRSRATVSGYFNNPEATASEFHNGYWKSGDLGYLDAQGYLYIVDRKKDMIITGGFNVYAVEVEAALTAHPAVENAAVVGVPHDEWGEAVHAEVVLRAGAQVSTEALIEHVKSRLGRFKAPKSIEFVPTLPMSVVGKVMRRQIREKYWQRHTRRVS
ncbi:AMP-binding protein [Paraburkholderia phymatum]|uniref:AMP-binding protein n=1 Tax=Paraburkholderia phymatum TaxID=148447 RepID=A0ACC6TY17_9BURK